MEGVMVLVCLHHDVWQEAVSDNIDAVKTKKCRL